MNKKDSHSSTKDCTSGKGGESRESCPAQTSEAASHQGHSQAGKWTGDQDQASPKLRHDCLA